MDKLLKPFRLVVNVATSVAILLMMIIFEKEEPTPSEGWH